MGNDDFIKEHLGHVITQFKYSYEKLNTFEELNKDGKPQARIEINLVLESFLLYGRNLIEFLFFKNKKYKDDARASDYCSQPFQISSELRIFERISKEVLHLTYSRQYGTPKTKEWDRHIIYSQLIEQLKLFRYQLKDPSILDEL